MTITLTSDQQHAINAMNAFAIDPVEKVFVLSGYSGTGKSSVIKHFLGQLPAFVKTAKLIKPDLREYLVELTATTNKAAENFAQLSGQIVNTIHSYLGLRVQTDYSTGITNLIPKSVERKSGVMLFVDEASYIDKQLLGLIFKLTHECKVFLIGDPAQLTAVKSNGAPVFDAHFTGAHLSQVVRQAEGNPIVSLSTKFRETVTSGEFFSFTPDGHAIQYLERDAFNLAIEKEFIRPDWKYSDSKVLAWTNKCVIGYNHAIQDHVKGNPEFKVGDYAVCNSFVTLGRQSLKTDQMVCITHINPDTEEYGVPGNLFTLDGSISCFMPKSLQAKNARIKQAKAASEFNLVERMQSQWIDLRSVFACTINKAQGSTFDAVYIDLDDVRKVNSGTTMARLLYVAVSRARKHVFLTGDIA